LGFHLWVASLVRPVKSVQDGKKHVNLIETFVHIFCIFTLLNTTSVRVLALSVAAVTRLFSYNILKIRL
jgi:hypothetical protein